MINASQLKELVIKPALHELVMYSDNAVELLLFTCAVESLGGTYLKQLKGPAVGIYQMEPATHNDIWQNYINHRGSLIMIMASAFDCTRMPSEDRLIYDLRYATAMARLHYARVPEPLPDLNDIQSIWVYYKTHYNTIQGSATKDKSIAKYLAYAKT